MSDENAPTTPNAAPTSPTDAAPDSDAAATPPPEEPKYEATVRGEKKEVPLSELIKRYEKAEGLEDGYRALNAEKKRVEAILSRVPEDPMGAIAALVGDKSRAAKTALAQMMKDPEIRAEVEAYMLEQYEYEGLPVDERRKVDETRSLKEQAEELRRIKAVEQQRQEQELSARYQQQLGQAFEHALTEAGAPVNKSTFRAMVAQFEGAFGQQQITRELVAEFAQAAKQEYEDDLRTRLGGLDVESLAQLLGDDALTNLRKRDVAAVEAKKGPKIERMPARSGPKPSTENGKRQKGVINVGDYFAKIRGER
jgi:hypothetical protein